MMKNGWYSLLLGLGIFLASNFSVAGGIAPPTPSVNPALAKHQSQYAKPRLQQVGDKVYVAVGYDIANFAFIVGDEGVVLFDTGMQTSTSAAALQDFRKITDKPVVAIVYSHGHLDHAGGIRAFIPNDDVQIPIYGGSSWKTYRNEEAIPRTPVRALYQMGVLLPVGPEGTVGAGTGPVARFNSLTGFLPPNRLVQTDTEIELDIPGVRIVLRAMPSDIHDGITAWLPDEKIVLTGDLVYPHLPAIATPRFEKEREVWRNLESIEWVRALPAEHLVPGHLRVISGKENVTNFVRNFRDIIQFMNDQTMRLLRNGLGPLETAAAIRELMPGHLRNDPNLGEFYHRLDWVVRGLYTKSGGWFTGDVIDLVQIAPAERANRMVTLAGGRDQLRTAIEAAYNAGDLAWAAEMGRHLQLSDANDASARQLLANVLRALAYQQQTANARNYLLTEALVLEGAVDLARIPVGLSPPEQLRPIEDKYLLRAMAVRLNPQASSDMNRVVQFDLTDGDGTVSSRHILTVRKGVLDIQQGAASAADLSIVVDRETFLLIAGANIDWQAAFASGALTASDRALFDSFSQLFYPR